MFSTIRGLTPLRKLLLGYLGLIVCGWALLCLPFSSAPSVSVLDHLFTAVTAVTTTGLTTASIANDYTFAGQFVVLLLFQLGGIGYMALAGVFLLSGLYATGEDDEVVDEDYDIPDDVPLGEFIRNVVRFTLLLEFAGAALLSVAFFAAGEEQAVWRAVFMSISAFCTTGLDNLPDGLAPYRADGFVNAVIMLLSLAGSLGFFFLTDLKERFVRPDGKGLNLTSRIIVLYFGGALTLGLFAFWNDDKLGLLAALFHTVSSITTTGFSTVDVGTLGPGLVAVVVPLMFIGAAPSGTGGGIKNTAFVTVVAALWARVREHERVSLLGRGLPDNRVRTAIAVLLAGLLFGVLGSVALVYCFPQDPVAAVFEAVSALGTVGLSRGITAELGAVGQGMLLLLMFVGRVGMLSVLTALFVSRDDGEEEETSHDDVAVGE